MSESANTELSAKDAPKTAPRGMTEVVSLRNFRLATLSGHVIQFMSGEPKLIPNVVLADAMEKGCVPTAEFDSTIFERDKRRARVEFKGELRASIIALFIEDFINTNNTKDFDAAGEVKHQVLSEAIGFDVHHAEAQDVFRAVVGARHSNEPLGIAKDAPLVKQIIEASNKQDLLELVPHTKLKADAVKGMQTRDLRKMMLASFSGLTNE